MSIGFANNSASTKPGHTPQTRRRNRTNKETKKKRNKMGNCACSKPWKNSDSSVVGAYYFDENECFCGSNTFKLESEPDHKGWPDAKKVIEGQLSECAELVVEYATRGCCCESLRFEEAIVEINKSWSPGVNAKIEPMGYLVDCYTWSEWQYNGQSSRKKYFLVLRIKEAGGDKDE